MLSLVCFAVLSRYYDERTSPLPVIMLEIVSPFWVENSLASVAQLVSNSYVFGMQISFHCYLEVGY